MAKASNFVEPTIASYQSIMQGAFLTQLKQWADTPVKKRLLDEWRFEVGKAIADGDVEKATSMTRCAFHVLKFSDYALTDYSTSEHLQAKMANSRIAPEIQMYSNEQESNDVLTLKTNNLNVADIKEKTKSNVFTNHHGASLNSGNRGTDVITHSFTKSTLIAPVKHENAVVSQVNDTQINLLCGFWPQFTQANKFVMRFTGKSPLEIQEEVMQRNVFTSRVECVTIVSDTKWAGRKAPPLIDELSKLCQFIQESCPNAYIRLVGFYGGVNSSHLTQYNDYLKSIAEGSKDIFYVPFNKIVKPREALALSNGGVSTKTLTKMLKRVCQ